MPSKLAKVQKHVKKKKGDKIKSLHENSRDARRLQRAGSRDDRVARMTAVREKANKLWIGRVAFFKDSLPDELHPLSIEASMALIDGYLDRHVDALGELRAERRAGRPPSNRQLLLEQQMNAEQSEYDGGFWLPNLQDEETLIKLDQWNGEWVSLAPMRFVRIDRHGVSKESQFPPRGAS